MLKHEFALIGETRAYIENTYASTRRCLWKRIADYKQVETKRRYVENYRCEREKDSQWASRGKNVK